jgi:ABC-type antimicrobial peptide transport system permease subunit
VTIRTFIIGLVGGLVGAAVIFGIFTLTGASIVTNGSTQSVQGGPASFATTSGALTPEQIYQQATPGVVEVQSTFPSI